MKHIACLYNPKSGSAISAAEIRELFKPYNVQVDCYDIAAGIEVLQQKMRQHQILVAAGGDGTVNAAAQIALKLDIPLGILPVGTLNHFAKDLGLPREIAEAAKVIAAGKVQDVDYATVNDKVFLNTSSIGIYPSTVLRREKRSLLGKWPAAVVAFLAALFRKHTIPVRIQTKESSWSHHSPLIFVGNNIYQLQKVGFTKRDNLTSGKLFVYAVQASRPTALLLLAFLSLFGMRSRRTDFMQNTSGAVTIESSRESVNVAVDGEVYRLTFPLKYQMHQGGLQVIVP